MKLTLQLIPWCCHNFMLYYEYFQYQCFIIDNLDIIEACWYCLYSNSSGAVCAIWDICLKLIINSNLVKFCSPITSVSVVQSFWNYAQSKAVILPCSVQNFKMIELSTQILWTNEISWDLSLRWVFDRYPILHSTQESCHLRVNLSKFCKEWCKVTNLCFLKIPHVKG